jgi:hypothetical protein
MSLVVSCSTYRAAVGQQRDQALRGKHAERLAQGRARNAELVAQHSLVEAGARREHALHDHPLQLSHDGLVQHLRLDRDQIDGVGGVFGEVQDSFPVGFIPGARASANRAESGIHIPACAPSNVLRGHGPCEIIVQYPVDSKVIAKTPAAHPVPSGGLAHPKPLAGIPA